ncbi:MAG: VOC family protein [Actinomycetota bacterium]
MRARRREEPEPRASTVDDVDAHYERARAAGAEIGMEPTDQPYGDRRYDAEDLEGHDWFFAQRLS